MLSKYWDRKSTIGVSKPDVEFCSSICQCNENSSGSCSDRLPLVTSVWNTAAAAVANKGRIRSSMFRIMSLVEGKYVWPRVIPLWTL